MNYSGYERDRFWVNPGAGAPFRELGYSVGLDYDADGRANLAFDFDNDGDLDLALLSLQRLQLLENLSPGGRHWVRLRLQATRGEPHALGAVVQVETAAGSQVDFVKATGGLSTATPLDLHFGLGDADVVDALSVRWPDGSQQRFEAVAADGLWLVKQGEERLTRLPLRRWAERLEDVRPAGSVALPERLPLLKGGESALPRDGKPTVLNFFASWCAPCREELPVLQRLAARRDDVEVVLVNVDEDLEAAKRFVRETGVRLPVHRPTGSLLADLFGGASEEVRLPATIVFDAQGEMRRAFSRSLSASDLDAAIRSVRPLGLERGDGELLAQQGLYELESQRPEDAIAALEKAVRLAPEHVPSLINLAAAYSQTGAWQRAADLLSQAVRLRPDHELAQANLGVALVRLGREAEAVAPLRRAVELRPEAPVAQYYLAAALAHSGRLEEAKSRVASWLAGHPKDQQFLELEELLASAPGDR